MIRLVVNADDLGYAEKRDAGIMKTIRDGIVTSASILANGRNAEKTVLIWKKEVEKMVSRPSLGLHLNFTEGAPIAPIDQVGTLLESSPSSSPKTSNEVKDCVFRGKFGFERAVLNKEISMKEIEIETRAQITWFLKRFGRLPSHIDGHNHAHVLPGICRVIAKVCAKSKIPWIRLPLEEARAGCMSEFCKRVLKNAKAAKTVMKEYGLKFVDKFYGMSLMGRGMSQETLRGVFKELTSTVSTRNSRIAVLPNASDCKFLTAEIMVHPGYPSDYGDNFSKSEDRQHELEQLTNETLIKWFEENQMLFQTCSYDHIHYNDHKRALRLLDEACKQTTETSLLSS